MLSDATLDPHLRVADQFMHDWMHMVFVSGVWNVVLNMLLESLRKVKHDIYAVVRKYVEQWRWPASMKKGKFWQLFADARRAPNAKQNHFRCSASEGLSLYALIRHFLEVVVMPAGTCSLECAAYVALADLIDCLKSATHHGTKFISANTLDRSAEAFLDAYDAAWGMQYSTPKFHWTLHFGDCLRRNGFLISCWTLERKHKVPKRYGSEIRNLSMYDKGLLQEVTCHHMGQLSDPNTFAFDTTGLVQPRSASPMVLAFVRDALRLKEDTPLNVLCATRCRHSSRISMQCL